VSHRRRTRILAVLAGASMLAAAACSGDDDDEAITEETSGATSAATEPEATTAETEVATTESEGTEPETTEGETGSSEPGGAGGEVGGSACGEPHGPYEENAEAPSGEVRVAWNQAFYSFNGDTNRGGATANNNVLYMLNGGFSGQGFSYYDADLNYVNNDQFGTCTVDSLDPLTITYTINEGVTWSDGVQVDAADMLLTWASNSGVFNDATSVVTDTGVTAQADADGSPIVLDPSGAPLDSANPAYASAFDADGALLEGYTYQASTGISFDAASESLQLITQFPEISEDGLSLTATWDTFYVDFAVDGPFPGVPAHVVAQNALGIEDPVEAKTAMIDALRARFDDASGDPADVKAIAESWNLDFDFTSLPDNPSVYASYGPYVLTDFTEDGTMTLEAREDYTWGPQPKVQTIIYSIISDPTAAVQAMANEEVDIIQPQATTDILTQLEGIADRGIEVLQDNGATYEHVDLAQDNGGPFDPATYDGDAETALAVRKAFLLSLPRQEIVDRLIIPLNPDAVVRNSQMAVPGEPTYDALVAANGSDEYAETDTAAAEQLLTDAGVTTPIDVRFLYDNTNPRRLAQYELIRDAVVEGGFNLIDAGREDWSANLVNTSIYDAALFGWQTTSIAVADSMPNYVSDGTNNYYGYSNPELDALSDELNVTTDPARQEEIIAEVESILFADAFGLPIFQHPQITAYNSTYVAGVSNIAIAPTVLFNVWDWEAVS
jgi:peptide/nickel transport system substrate-binding protein